MSQNWNYVIKINISEFKNKKKRTKMIMLIKINKYQEKKILIIEFQFWLIPTTFWFWAQPKLLLQLLLAVNNWFRSSNCPLFLLQPYNSFVFKKCMQATKKSECWKLKFIQHSVTCQNFWCSPMSNYYPFKYCMPK